MHSFNFFLYGRSSNSGTILVAILYILSNFNTWFFLCRDYITSAYSSFGLVIVVIIFLIISLSWKWKAIRIFLKSSSLLLKLPIVCALTTCWLSLFQSSTTLFVNQFLPISLLNLHFSSLNLLFFVLSWLLIVRTFPTSPLSIFKDEATWIWLISV